MSSEPQAVPVHFSAAVKTELSGELTTQLEPELREVFARLEPERTLEKLSAPRWFSGHRVDLAAKVVLAVEAQYKDSFDTHIVKLGQKDVVSEDFEQWQSCTRGRQVASRIMAPVRLVDLPRNRAAVVYRDSFVLFGPDSSNDPDTQPGAFEHIASRSICTGSPCAMSVERALSHIYSDMAVWFYAGARDDRQAAHEFYSSHLRLDEDRTRNVLWRWREEEPRLKLRREVIQVLCGSRQPDADPVTSQAEYLDPVDYMEWALSDVSGARVPATIIGRSHGDLHGRNILVGVRRNEVQYPAIFDYGDMSQTNAIAWDFAKLETELKVRILPRLIRENAQVANWLMGCSKPGVPGVSGDSGPGGVTPRSLLRRRRLAAFLGFESIVHTCLQNLADESDFERQPVQIPPVSGVPALDRLIAVVLRVRREAACVLGDAASGRQSRWMDELYFALGVYGLVNVRWNYQTPHQESALVAAGAALAQMPSTPALLAEQMQSGATAAYPCVSYLAPLAVGAGYWNRGDHTAAAEYFGSRVLRRNDNGELMPEIQWAHATPLISQALLCEIEQGNLRDVETCLESYRDRAVEFRDYEMLARVGRLYKDAGDLLIRDRPQPPASAMRMYSEAFTAYEVAYRATDNWYVGINAATLAWMTGEAEKAAQYAEKVLSQCRSEVNTSQQQRYWINATAGEASLVLRRADDALHFYTRAVDETNPANRGMIASTYAQLNRMLNCLNEGPLISPVMAILEPYIN